MEKGTVLQQSSRKSALTVSPAGNPCRIGLLAVSRYRHHPLRCSLLRSTTIQRIFVKAILTVCTAASSALTSGRSARLGSLALITQSARSKISRHTPLRAESWHRLSLCSTRIRLCHRAVRDCLSLLSGTASARRWTPIHYWRYLGIRAS